MITVNQAKLRQLQNDKRNQVIMARLSAIDEESLRAVRATLLKKNNKKDDETLVALEDEAETLRLELQEMS